jgi:hypothetical protein
MSMKTKPMTPDAVKVLADEAAQLLDNLQQMLPLDDGLLAHDRKVANIRQSVPTAAIETAVSVLEDLGDKGGGFDLEGTREALAFEKELGRVATKLHVLASRVDATILKRRSLAAATASALSRSLGVIARSDGTVTPHLDRLRPQLKRKSPAKAAIPAPTSTDSGQAVMAPSVTITPTGAVHQ